jgi:glycosyltransferase involved in cell wall biosynthesis
MATRAFDMRILLINYEYPPVGGGAANATWEIARAMVNLGHEPVVLTARYKHRQADTANPGIKIIHVPAIRRRKDRCSIFEMTTFVLSAMLRIRSILRREKIEGMIAFFSIPCGPIAWWGWRGTRTPYVVALRGGDVPGTEPKLNFLHRMLQPVRRTVFRSAQSIVANSSALRDKAQRADPFSVRIITNGVDTNYWRPAAHSANRSIFRFLVVGRLHQQKNLCWLLEKFGRLAESTNLPPWEVHVVGDGEQQLELRRLAERAGIRNQAHWHGWLDRNALRSVYQQSHLLVSAAHYEGTANTMLEAMACGLPILCAESALAHELSTLPGVNSFEPNSAATFLREAKKYLLSPDKPLPRPPLLSWQQTAQQFCQLFNQ